MAQLGFIGLGIMGKPMARHLLASGQMLAIYNRSQAAVQELAAAGAVACTSSRKVAEKSAIIFTMVSDTPDVESVLFGNNGVVEGLKAGSIVVDMSTISPLATKDFAKRISEKGCFMLDAPVSGGQVGAENATLSIMVGGDPEVFEKVKPYFEIMGKMITLIGPNGAGQICKAANQIVVAGTIQAVSEALLFAEHAGADPAKVREALLGGFAQSRILDLHGRRMLERNFKPGFRIRLQQKDLNIVLDTALALGLTLPGTASARLLYASLSNAGGADLDHSALLLALEQLVEKPQHENDS
ncbi:MAG TPA: 2-hydroxy-3-oxopropionate reductase [Dissulfurispiraceae bacterium]|nr:2-hydroxy-3-oxopropionate reductase [Dissulfurispiraceae bacterium]